MQFHAIFWTNAPDEDGYRLVDAPTLPEAVAQLRAEIEARGHSFWLQEIIETDESFAERANASRC